MHRLPAPCSVVWPSPSCSLFFSCRRRIWSFMEKSNMHEATAVGAVCDRTFFAESRKNARSQTAPTIVWRLMPIIWAFFALPLFAQALVRLTLDDAKTMALANHPQVLAAQNEASYSAQEVTLARAPYFPTISADLTGTQSNDPAARIGAGALSASRLFDRAGQGIVFSQVVT